MTIFQNVRKGLIPARLTVDDVFALTETGVLAGNENLELIAGEIVPMAAAKASDHETAKSRLNYYFSSALPKHLRLFVESSIALSSDTLVEPDLTVLPKGARTRDISPEEISLVIEVADSSLAYDLRVKAPLYAAAGIREYWVVDAVRQTIRVHRAPEDGIYADVEEYEAHDTVAALIPGIAVRLDTLD